MIQGFFVKLDIDLSNCVIQSSALRHHLSYHLPSSFSCSLLRNCLTLFQSENKSPKKAGEKKSLTNFMLSSAIQKTCNSRSRPIFSMIIASPKAGLMAHGQETPLRYVLPALARRRRPDLLAHLQQP